MKQHNVRVLAETIKQLHTKHEEDQSVYDDQI